MARVVLLVCGEPMRGDDGVALAVIDALPPDARARADIRQVGHLMPDDFDELGAPVIVVDAVHGAAAGEVVDLPLTQLGAAYAHGLSPASSHVLPIPLTLGIVERLRGGLPDGRFVGIGAATYAVGAPLSPPVRDAVAACSARLEDWIDALGALRRGEADACA
jgi:hydrogenase maturation protease